MKHQKTRETLVRLKTQQTQVTRIAEEIIPAPDLLRSGEVARLLGVCDDTVRTMVRVGALPSVLVGQRERRVPRAVILERLRAAGLAAAA